MATLSLRLPESLHRKLAEVAKAEGISLNQLIATAAAEKLSALTTEEYLAQRAERASKRVPCRSRRGTRCHASRRRRIASAISETPTHEGWLTG